jgi:hypothetical protein
MTATMLASDFLTGSILTLVLPLGVLLAILVWFSVLWWRGAGER